MNPTLRSNFIIFFRPVSFVAFFPPHADGSPSTLDMSPEPWKSKTHNLQESEPACLVAPGFILCLETLQGLCQGPSWKHCLLVFSQ